MVKAAWSTSECTGRRAHIVSHGEGRWSRPLGQRVSVPSVLRYQSTPHVLVASPYADVLLRTRKVASRIPTRGGINHVYSHLFHVRRNHAFPTFSCMFAKFTLIPTFCCAKNCEICIFFAKFLQCSHFCCMFAKITLIPTFCCMFAEITCIPSTPKASRSS